MAEGKAALDFVAVQCFQCNVRHTACLLLRSPSDASPPLLRQAYQVQRGGKKAARFSCKLCGAKQSIQVVFARSARAVDVRKAVQGLNEGRAATDARAEAAHLARAAGIEDGEEQALAEAPQAAPRAEGGSRWAEYLDEAEDDAPDAAAAEEADARFVTSLEAARTAKRRSSHEPHEGAAAAPSKRAAQPPPAAYEPQPALQNKAYAAPQPRSETQPRWGAPAAPAPLSPRNAAAPAAPAPAAAGGGKWAAFAGDEEDW